MTAKRLQNWCNENAPYTTVEREGPMVLVFDVQTQTPQRFRTMREAAAFLGATDSIRLT